MLNAVDQAEVPTAIHSNLAAIFVSLELSRSVWLITSLSPGFGAKMSKHSVVAGDVAALLARFAELRQKALGRTGQSFPIVSIQEAGLDGFWLHRVLESEGVESHVVEPLWSHRLLQAYGTNALNSLKRSAVLSAKPLSIALIRSISRQPCGCLILTSRMKLQRWRRHASATTGFVLANAVV